MLHAPPDGISIPRERCSRRCESLRITEISYMNPHVPENILETPLGMAFSQKQMHFMAPTQKKTGQIVSNKTGSACNKDLFHFGNGTSDHRPVLNGA